MLVIKSQWTVHSRVIHLPDEFGGLNRSMQRSARTHMALKTKAESAGQVRSAEHYPGSGFSRVPPNRRPARGSIVESTNWMVLHRPPEPAALIGKVNFCFVSWVTWVLGDMAIFRQLKTEPASYYKNKSHASAGQVFSIYTRR